MHEKQETQIKVEEKSEFFFSKLCKEKEEGEQDKDKRREKNGEKWH